MLIRHQQIALRVVVLFCNQWLISAGTHGNSVPLLYGSGNWNERVPNRSHLSSIQKNSIEIAITRSALFSSKCSTTNSLAAGLRPDHAGRAYSAPPEPLAGLRWWASGKGNREGERGRAKEGKRGLAGRKGISLLRTHLTLHVVSYFLLSL